TTLDLPDPLGPTTQVTPGSKVNVVAEANDLNPRRVSVLRCTGVSLRGRRGRGAEVDRPSPRHRPGNQSAISRSADSTESEPCTRFWVTLSPQSRPRSPRMVPGGAVVGSVLPARTRKPSMTRCPATTAASTGPDRMKSTSGVKKGLP